MTQEQILKKAIEKAIKNGLKQEPTEHVYLISRVFGVKTINKEWLRGFILSHQFAKAFFGRKENPIVDYDLSGEPIQYMGWEWQYHLQQMVLSNDPINYLRRFI